VAEKADLVDVGHDAEIEFHGARIPLVPCFQFARIAPATTGVSRSSCFARARAVVTGVQGSFWGSAASVLPSGGRSVARGDLPTESGEQTKGRLALRDWVDFENGRHAFLARR
jgi:hypothetical protein